MPHDARAVTHRRAAQASLVPRAMTSGSVAPSHQQPRDGRTGGRADGEADDLAPVGAVAPERGRPKMATDPLPASAVPDHPGQGQDQRHRPPPATPRRARATSARGAPTRSEPSTHATAVTRTIGTTAGANPAAAAMTAPRTTTWPDGPAPPVRSGLDRVGSDVGRPGQAQRDEGEEREGDEPVPAARAERAVGQRQPEVADDRDDARPRRHQRAQATRHAPGADRDAAEEQDLLQRAHGAEEHGAASGRPARRRVRPAPWSPPRPTASPRRSGASWSTTTGAAPAARRAAASRRTGRGCRWR